MAKKTQFMSRREVLKTLCISRHTLVQLYRVRCDPLNGEPLTPTLGNDPDSDKDIEQYDSAVVAKLKMALDDAERKGRWIAADGRAWINTKRLLKELRQVKRGLTDMTVVNWRDNGCSHLEGKKLTAELKALDRSGRRKMWHLEMDIFAIKESIARSMRYGDAIDPRYSPWRLHKLGGPDPETIKRMARAGVITAHVERGKFGGAKNSKQVTYSKKEVETAWRDWNAEHPGVYDKDEPEKKRLDVVQAAHLIGISQSHLRNLIKQGDVKAEKRNFHERWREWTLLETDVLAFKKRFWQTRYAPPPASPWKATFDILASLGYQRGSQHHINAYKMLLALRDAYPIAERFRNRRTDQNQLVWYYDSKKLAEILRGKDLLEFDFDDHHQSATTTNSVDPGKPNGQQTPGISPKRRGPVPSKSTAQVHKACYEGMLAGKTLKELLREIRERYPEPNFSPPKRTEDVSLYAKRHAQASRPPLPWPIPRLSK